MLRRGLRKATRDNPRADVLGFPALGLGDGWRVLGRRLDAMAFAMCRKPVGFIVRPAHGQRDTVRHIPRFASVYLAAAYVAQAGMALEKRDAGLRGKRAAGRHG
jgi:hypothetical protein